MFEPIKKPEPTTYPCGSPEKVEVLRQRVENNEQLWHPDDSAKQRMSRANPIMSQGSRRFYTTWMQGKLVVKESTEN